MTELRRYRLDQIAAGIHNLDAYLRGDNVRKDALPSDADAADLASAGEVAKVLAELLFRDKEGDYWVLNPFARQWYHW